MSLMDPKSSKHVNQYSTTLVWGEAEFAPPKYVFGDTDYFKVDIF